MNRYRVIATFRAKDDQEALAILQRTDVGEMLARFPGAVRFENVTRRCALRRACILAAALLFWVSVFIAVAQLLKGFPQ